MARLIERFRELSLRTVLYVLGISASALLAEAFIACSMGFQPGWANGWPGVSKHDVFAAFVTGVLFFMLVSVGALVFVVPCFGLQRLMKRDFVGWGAFIALMLAWCGLAVFFCSRAFPAFRSSIMEEWP